MKFKAVVLPTSVLQDGSPNMNALVSQNAQPVYIPPKWQIPTHPWGSRRNLYIVVAVGIVSALFTLWSKVTPLLETSRPAASQTHVVQQYPEETPDGGLRMVYRLSNGAWVTGAVTDTPKGSVIEAGQPWYKQNAMVTLNYLWGEGNYHKFKLVVSKSAGPVETYTSNWVVIDNKGNKYPAQGMNPANNTLQAMRLYFNQAGRGVPCSSTNCLVYVPIQNAKWIRITITDLARFESPTWQLPMK